MNNVIDICTLYTSSTGSLVGQMVINHSVVIGARQSTGSLDGLRSQGIDPEVNSHWV